MTILPTKVKKRREGKEDKRGDEWNGHSGHPSSHSGHPSSHSGNSHSLRQASSTNGLSHASYSTHNHAHSHLFSHCGAPPRKVIRTCKGGVPSSFSSISIPTPLPKQSLILSPRGSREENERGEDGEGPNSDDEYDRGFRDEEMERNFEFQLKDERGLEIKKMVGDGACLFRGVSHQIYGDEDMHAEVRRLCLDYMEKNREHFEQFITEDFNAYIARKRRLTVHGNHVELQAISEIFNRPIEIYEYNINPINVFHPKSSSSTSGGSCTSNENKDREGGDHVNAPIRLSYHGSTHYNAVIDPRVATVGVGLGLPSFDHAVTERKLVADAISSSEMHQIEQAMLKDKMRMTDWERTEADLKDQVLRASYMEYARSLEGCNQPSTSSTSPCYRHSIASPPSRPSSRPTSRPSIQSHSSRSFIPSSPQPCSSKHVETPERSTAADIGGGGVPAMQSSLYEELLMVEALEWNEEANYESSLAEALLISQQTFFTEYRRRSEEEGNKD